MTSVKLEKKTAVASNVSFAYLFQSPIHKASISFVTSSKSFRLHILCFKEQVRAKATNYPFTLSLPTSGSYTPYFSAWYCEWNLPASKQKQIFLGLVNREQLEVKIFYFFGTRPQGTESM